MGSDWTPGDRRRTGLVILLACALAVVIFIAVMVGTFKPLWDNANRPPTRTTWVEPTPTVVPRPVGTR